MIEDGWLSIVFYHVRFMHHIDTKIVGTNMLTPLLWPICRQWDTRIFDLCFNKFHLPFDRCERRRCLHQEIDDGTLFGTVRAVLFDQIKRIVEIIEGFWVTLVRPTKWGLNDLVRAWCSDRASIPQKRMDTTTLFISEIKVITKSRPPNWTSSLTCRLDRKYGNRPFRNSYNQQHNNCWTSLASSVAADHYTAYMACVRSRWPSFCSLVYSFVQVRIPSQLLQSVVVVCCHESAPGSQYLQKHNTVTLLSV